MKLSRKFLNDYLTLDNITTKNIAEEMLLIGHEYESIDSLGSGTNLVIGEVLEVKKHPNADTLYVCLVNLGSEVVQIVCGAANVQDATKVVVAKVGAVLQGDFKIKQSLIRGEESHGMICSLSELGIESKYQSEEDKNGIHKLNDDAIVGTDPLAYLMFDDEIINFELTANRSDLLSIIGMAHEVSALYDEKIKLPDHVCNNEYEDINNYFKIKVETDKTPLYLARMVKDIQIKESPMFIKSRLMASGIRPINNIVDISNYVMLEYGQPLHFFDYDKLNKEITIRDAHDNEEITTLDGELRILNNDDIVITTNNTPVALAGVMGGLNTEITNDTKHIIIESAIFDPVSIRKTSKKTLVSESSLRFEKKISKYNTYDAINRAVYLLEKYANAKVIKNTLVHDVLFQKEVSIPISLDFIKQRLGINITEEEVINIFDKLNFAVKDLNNNEYLVTVPHYRLDLEIKEDLLEEIIRLYDQDKIITKLPNLTVKPGVYNAKYLFLKKVSRLMLNTGLYETRTYTLTNKKQALMFNSDKSTYEISNPMSDERRYLRQSLIPSLMNVASYNLARKQEDISFFEVSNVYLNKDTEISKLAILVAKEEHLNTWKKQSIKKDFFYVKGLIELLFTSFNLNNRYEFIVDEYLPDLHPHQSATIYLDKQKVGFIGLTHPGISKVKYYVAEIDLNKIFNAKTRTPKAKEISKYPEVVKDFAFVVSKDVLAGDLLRAINKSDREIINVELFDIYNGTPLQDNEKSLAFKVTMQSLDKTLNDEDIEKISNKIITNTQKQYKGFLREK